MVYTFHKLNNFSHHVPCARCLLDATAAPQAAPAWLHCERCKVSYGRPDWPRACPGCMLSTELPAMQQQPPRTSLGSSAGAAALTLPRDLSDQWQERQEPCCAAQVLQAQNRMWAPAAATAAVAVANVGVTWGLIHVRRLHLLHAAGSACHHFLLLRSFLPPRLALEALPECLTQACTPGCPAVTSNQPSCPEIVCLHRQGALRVQPSPTRSRASCCSC